MNEPNLLKQQTQGEHPVDSAPNHNGNGNHNGHHRGQYVVVDKVDVPGTSGRAKVYRTKFIPDAEPVASTDWTELVKNASVESLRELADAVEADNSDSVPHDE